MTGKKIIPIYSLRFILSRKLITCRKTQIIIHQNEKIFFLEGQCNYIIYAVIKYLFTFKYFFFTLCN